MPFDYWRAFSPAQRELIARWAERNGQPAYVAGVPVEYDRGYVVNGTRNPFWISWHSGRREHAFLLRCENVSYNEIATRLGVTSQMCRIMVRQFSRTIRQSMTVNARTRWSIS